MQNKCDLQMILPLHAGRSITLRKKWQHLAVMGPKFDYNPNPGKTTLVIQYPQSAYVAFTHGIVGK